MVAVLVVVEVLLDVNELDILDMVKDFIDADELEVELEGVAVELAVALDVEVDVGDDVMLVHATVAWHAPVIDGTESTPDPIATKFVPQLAEFARRRFRLS